MCDSRNVEIRHDRRAKYRYLKQEHVLEGQEHTICNECGTSFYQEGQIERNNERFMTFAHGIVKNIAPWEFVDLREKYDLTQEQANTIFGCGPTQFSKWERGESAPTATAAIALREALENPEFMYRLAARVGVNIAMPQEAQAVATHEECAYGELAIYRPSEQVVDLFEDCFTGSTILSVSQDSTVWATKTKYVHAPHIGLQ